MRNKWQLTIRQIQLKDKSIESSEVPAKIRNSHLGFFAHST